MTFLEVKQKMADYCVYQDRCHYEVEQKLKEYNLIQEAKDEILIFLIQENFLNEERFAKNFVRGKFNQKKWGKQKIQNSLYQKRITKNLIKKALQEIDEDNYIEVFTKMASRKWQLLTNETHLVKKKKLYNYMLQKGYETTLIYDFLNNPS